MSIQRCDNCGKVCDRLYGMSDGSFYCKDCADIPNILKPEIDRKTWQVQIFTTKRPDKDFNDRVNEFLRSIGDCKVKTSATFAVDTYILTIMYREK